MTVSTNALLTPHGAWDALAGAASDTLVITAREPWQHLKAVAADSLHVLEPIGVAQDELDGLVAHAPPARAVIGIGGGTALDTAKYVAWKRSLPLTLMPSILSVDAAFTEAIGVRIDGNVRYVGDVTPERVVVDPELIRTAPPELNRAGVGDLLSCHTGVFDWRLAQADGHPAGPAVPWDDALAGLGTTLVTEIHDRGNDIGAVTDTGIATLATGFKRVGEACRRAGHARFEEGSEHFFAYALEARTRQTYIHGELIAFASLVMSIVQGNDPFRVATVIRRSQVRATPAHLGIDAALFESVLTGLRTYARENNLWWSIVDRKEIDKHLAAEVWSEADLLLGVNKSATG